MIVKTIEEMQDKSENFNVIQTLRIYKEKITKKLQRSKFNLLIHDSDTNVLIAKNTLRNSISNMFRKKSTLTDKST